MSFNAVNPNRFSGAYPPPRLHSHPAASRPETAAPEETPPEPPQPPPRQADLLYFTDIEPRPVEWLWHHRLAAGSVAVLSGDPGSGKTWVALAIAAALSQGQSPGAPNSTGDAVLPPCTILYAATHHQGSELLRPRFLGLGGDPARLALLRGMPDTPMDTPILEDALERTNARLLVLDPLHTWLAASDRHRAHQAARIFDTLAQLAEKHRCCILLVRHLRHRGRGSAAIELSGAVRTEFLVGSSLDAPSFSGPLSAFVQTKSNLGPLAPSLGFRIDPTPGLACAFQWTGLSHLTADDLQRGLPIDAGLPKRKRAAEWLRQQLRDGPLTHGTIERAAQRDGACMITIRRAKQDIGVVSTKNSDGAWYWELPQTPAPDATDRGGKSKN